MRMRCGHCGSAAVRRDYGGFATLHGVRPAGLSLRGMWACYCPRADSATDWAVVRSAVQKAAALAKRRSLQLAQRGESRY